MTKAQVNTQMSQAVMALEQSYKQQLMSLDLAKQQRTMAITQQAAQMSAQAKQYELQVEMQKNLMSAYGGMYGQGDKNKGGATKKPWPSPSRRRGAPIRAAER